MKKLLFVMFLVCVLTYSVSAQTVTTISAVQDTTGTGSGDSPFKDQVVTVEGVVSAEIWAFGSSYYIQDGSGPWSGVMVYDGGRENAYGDSIRITGTVVEYYGLTEIKDITEYVKLDSGKTVAPSLVTTGEIGTGAINSEAYEGVLVQVNNAVITNPDLGYGEWEIDDGSGPCRVDDAADYYFKPANYALVKSVVGVLNYNYNDTKIEPRLAWDVVEGGDFTRIQRIQQVRTSDLLRTPIDGLSDVSYATNPEDPFNAAEFPGDTVKVRGVVTMPTGLSYAGAGIKFLFSEIGGGPWSSLLSYNPDSTLYPALFEGDIIEMQGYITEYRTTQSNMTEFWLIGGVIDIVDFGQPIPDPDLVNTGDIRLPVTAEQWGTCLVYVKDATAVDINPTPYELFAVDDGTGSLLIDDDSDSLSNYPDPPTGTIADSIRGWIYHHYGSYADSTTYVLEPLYPSDIVWGAGPPAISNYMRGTGIPTPSDAVTVSVDVATNLTIAETAVHYKVGDGAYTKIVMNNTEGDTYSGDIPAQAAGSFVNYFITTTDVQGQSTMTPPDTSKLNYCYPVTDGTLSIADIQYTPWELADSPFEGVNVEITGIVTTDTAANNNYDTYVIQDAEGPLNGIFTFGINANLNRGDEITVYGTVTDYNADWHYKWDNNTTILVDSFKAVSSGNAMDAVPVLTGDLNGESEAVESYEGTSVRIENATLMSINSYDATFDDGSGTCLVDDDMISANFFTNKSEGYLYAFGDTLRPGDKVDMIQGVFLFSFGTYKIEVRDVNDYGSSVGVDANFVRIPLSYKLEQNFPNPFNPETRIYFEIPDAQQVKVVIYNMLGQKVRTLINDGFNPGFHVINWDGCDDSGNIVPTGIYIYRIKAGSFIASKKMMMMK
ncbi:T9SS type A sorting domain-containing protein [candidate division KSB1 bacterium]|nr:T9SS type A sorting domain-containing protein [candidate division KSB1 bacterium]MBL7095904.1 T9SS type A sorting domain-containing protein [candidate division KSB1 bacterium]